MKALTAIDIQYDFVSPKGALYVKDGETIIEAIFQKAKEYLANNDIVIFTQDWHPEKHCSFKNNGGQWPPHCIQNTAGSELVIKKLYHKNIFLLKKAFYEDTDSYSAFGGLIDGISLKNFLESKNILDIEICGLALDFCVKATAIDGVLNGYNTTVNVPLTKSVFPENNSITLKILSDGGIKLIQ